MGSAGEKINPAQGGKRRGDTTFSPLSFSAHKIFVSWKRREYKTAIWTTNLQPHFEVGAAGRQVRIAIESEDQCLSLRRKISLLTLIFWFISFVISGFTRPKPFIGKGWLAYQWFFIWQKK